MRHQAINTTAIIATMLGHADITRAADPNRFPILENLGLYRDFFASVCGKNGAGAHPASIPPVGCFSIRAGGSLEGVANGHALSVKIDANANETFVVDGVEIRPTGSSTTNHPLVRPMGSGFAFCSENAPSDCPVQIGVLVRQPGEFASFDVARQFKPNAFVTNQENWDAEQRRHDRN